MATPTTVKAWVYTTPGYPATLNLTTHPNLPEAPAPHHLFIQTRAVALNPVDIQLMNFPIFHLVRGPKIPGADFSGVVLAAGPDTSYKKGDEIIGFSIGKPTSGGLTEVMNFDEREGLLLKKPADWTFVQGAALPLVWLTARTCIEKVLPFVKGKTSPKIVVLGGSSATGMYVTYLAKQQGWNVLASCSGKNAEFVKSMGAAEVVDYTLSPSAVVGTVGLFKPDAIVDCVGGTECIGLAPQYVTIVGDKTSRSTMGGSALYWTKPWMLLRWALGAIGILNSYECIILDAKKEWLEESFVLPKDKIVIDSTFEFEKLKDAYERLDTSRARGKVVVTFQE